MGHLRDESRRGGTPVRLGVLGSRDLDDIHEAEAILAFVRLREGASDSGPRATAPVLQRRSEIGA